MERATFNNDWANILASEFELPYYKELKQFLLSEYASGPVYPEANERFAALQLTPYEKVKVVILGQDPYHGDGQAHGLSFSVKPGVSLPPSLRNIYKELQDDLGCPVPNHGCLESWAQQGVLLLNTVLSVRANTPNSHKGVGWERLTDRIIAALSVRKRPVVFILWGKHAQEKRALIGHSDRHMVISSAHPSPFAARKGFFGSRPFSRTNRFLKEIGSEEIDWQVPNI